jgi:sporulation protein YqfC
MKQFISEITYAFMNGGAQMAQKGYWTHRITDHADLCGESVPGVPIVELAGDHRLLVERHRGVIEYDPQCIRIRVAYGILCVSGSNMELTRMTAQQLIISGRINGISIDRRCK